MSLETSVGSAISPAYRKGDDSESQLSDWHDSLKEKLEFGKVQRPEFGPLWLDVGSRTLQVAGSDRAVHLTTQEYLTMWLFIRSQGVWMLSQEELLGFIYEHYPSGRDLPLSNGLQVFITNLRRKLISLSHGSVNIVTIKGLGYQIQLGQNENHTSSRH